MSNNIFSKFTNQYSLSKTLRFELKPVGKTLENMRNHLRWDKNLQTFLADQEIEDAYQILKPIFDTLHEEFITESLESDTAKNIDFSTYLLHYKNKLTDKNFDKTVKQYREIFEKAYKETSETFKQKAGKNEKGKDILTEKGYKILTEKRILEYIKKNINELSKNKSAKEKNDIENALKNFEGFYTYFSGFNQNRENYYETKAEKATSVATRTVHENLPKFCDNILQFKEREQDYLNAYDYLIDKNRTLQIKDAESGNMIPLQSINKELLTSNYFSNCLSQNGIKKYNQIIGHYNSLINLYNQAKSKEDNHFKKLSSFKMLWKQIGCGKKDLLFFTLTHDTKKEADENKESYQKPYSVEQLLEQIKQAGENYFQIDTHSRAGVNQDQNENNINTLPAFLDYISDKKKDNYEGLYWSKMAINTISNKYFANWEFLKNKLKDVKEVASYNKKREEQIKINDAVELTKIFEIIDQTKDWQKEGLFFKENLIKALPESEENNAENKNREKRRKIIAKASTPAEALLQMIINDIQEHAKQFTEYSDEILRLTEYKSKESKEKIKQWMDHTLAINQMMKYFLVKENKVQGALLDTKISNALRLMLLEARMTYDGEIIEVDWFRWYDALRNYLTKKPQDDTKKNKLKLNFENSTLAGGWDINKEPDNYCILLQDKKQKQYLAIIAKQEKKKGYNKIFEKTPDNQLYETDNEETLQKMEYKLLPGPNKMLPKCLLPKSDRKKYGATDEILSIYDEGGFKKNEESFTKEKLYSIINFYKSGLKKYEDWQTFDFVYKQTIEYKDISQFYSDIEKQGYKLNFVDINKSLIDQWIDEGKIYLFEIKNQDANDGKKEGHKNNLHTLYWKALFENIENRPKLNGEAEIFYRKALPYEKLEKIKDKNNKDIIKNYRFSREKFLFHVPITLNFCLKDTRTNDLINETFAQTNNLHFLGIDRGEKHLAYYSLVDQHGNIIDQGSFNKINDHNYHEKLDKLEKNRQEARKNWQTIGTIKELKEGYISQIVRKIADIATNNDNPAFIVLEDLSTGFKRGRQKIEKQIYQKFELALAKKLNFLVDKSAKNGELGSVTNALQLTPPVNNFSDIEKVKQFGIMLYTRANYTSQTDPATGWRKTIYLQKGSENDIRERFLKEFTDFGFDGKDYYFDYVDKNTGKPWRLYSGIHGKSLDRFRGKRGKEKNEWQNEAIDVVKMLDNIFASFDKKRSFKEQLYENKELAKINEHPAWESLRFTIDLIQQIRNTGEIERDNDFLLSPVRDDNAIHFDSRVYWDKEQKGEKVTMPSSGDANGAYNIARKGIVMNEHIKTWIKNGKKKNDLNLFISDTEWDLYLADKETWENKLSVFSSQEAFKKIKNN